MLSLSLSPSQLEAFRIYLTELKRWGRRFNLTGFKSEREIVLQGFLDSLACSALLPQEAGLKVVDIGSGAGFPGIPLKISSHALRLTLIEASSKKASFLKHIIRLLNLHEVTCAWARAEALAADPEHQEGYQVAFARAVADLHGQVRLALPFLQRGGILIAQKGKRGIEEARAFGGQEALGVKVREPFPIQIPFVPEERFLIVVERL